MDPQNDISEYMSFSSFPVELCFPLQSLSSGLGLGVFLK